MLDSIKNTLEILSDGLFNFFESIGNVLTFVVKMIADIGWVIENLNDNTANMDSWLGWMPQSMSATFISCVSIAIIFKVIGRE